MLILGVYEHGEFPANTARVNHRCRDAVKQTLRLGGFQGTLGQFLFIPKPDRLHCKMVLLVGCGNKENFSAKSFLTATQTAFTALRGWPQATALMTLVQLPCEEPSLEWRLLQTLTMAAQHNYVYRGLRTSPGKPGLDLKSLALPVSEKNKDLLKQGQAFHKALHLLKDLANHPANLCTPTF